MEGDVILNRPMLHLEVVAFKIFYCQFFVQCDSELHIEHILSNRFRFLRRIKNIEHDCNLRYNRYHNYLMSYH